MPQATSELQAKFPGCDTEALDVLGDDVTIVRGVIRPKQGVILTQRQYDAVEYLFQEWDYAFELPI